MRLTLKIWWSAMTTPTMLLIISFLLKYWFQMKQEMVIFVDVSFNVLPTAWTNQLGNNISTQNKKIQENKLWRYRTEPRESYNITTLPLTCLLKLILRGDNLCCSKRLLVSDDKTTPLTRKMVSSTVRTAINIRRKPTEVGSSLSSGRMAHRIG